MFGLRSRSALLSCLFPLVVPTVAQAQLRVLTHNISNYGGGRQSAIETAMFGVFEGRSARPDVFLLQEFMSASALSSFLSIVNNAPGSPGDYAAAPFVNGPDTDCAFVYRTSKLSYLGYEIVVNGGNSPSPPRNVLRYDVLLKGYSGAGARLSLYSSHMKAGTTDDDKSRRLLECQLIRDDAQSLGHPFLIGGDFNIQSASETSYIELTGSQVDNFGRFFDPIKTPGNWNSNNTFRFVHTQDPWNGASSGGMDDRFDFLLTSSDLVDGGGFDYLGNPNLAYSTSTWNDPNHSYRSWGNDGTTYNQPLKVTGNTMVGSAIAQALIDECGGQSGHLPVFFDLRVPGKLGAPVLFDMGLFKMFSNGQRTLTLSNAADTALWSANGINPLVYSMTAGGGFTVPGGQFSIAASGTRQHTVTVDTSSPGIKTGTIRVTSNDPDSPAYDIQVRAVVGPIPVGH
ncbi:MAG: hypothetical protein JST30_00090 [Armatimonadetes bacterium]|nr:hypothetical protein [Armatimonadota bacterium]